MKTVYVLCTLFTLQLCCCGDTEEEGASAPLPCPDILDITNPDHTTVTEHKNVTDDVIYQSFFPKNAPFKKIVEANVEIWTASKLEVCTAVLCTALKDVKKLSVHIRYTTFKYRFLYFEKKDDGWKMVSSTGLPCSDDDDQDPCSQAPEGRPKKESESSTSAESLGTESTSAEEDEPAFTTLDGVDILKDFTSKRVHSMRWRSLNPSMSIVFLFKGLGDFEVFLDSTFRNGKYTESYPFEFIQ